MSILPNITSYKFYNKDWFIAADVVRHYKLSYNYNTYYSNYYSNGRLLGPVESFEFRLSGSYLEEFKSLYGANNASLNKSKAVWLIDRETVEKLANKDNTKSKEKTVRTVESNPLSIKYNLGVDQAFEDLKIKHLVDNKNTAKATNPTTVVVDTSISAVTNSRTIGEIKDYKSVLPPIPIVIDQYKKPNIEQLSQDIASDKTKFISNQPIISSLSTTTAYSKYSEEDISDAITLLSSKLTNTPYQQEKLLESGSIRLDLFSCTRRSVYAIELKKGVITLDMIKEKLEVKHYLTSLINAYPDLNITFIFSSPMGITWDAFLYLQEASKSVGSHKIIYKPCSNLILDMINKKEKELPSYYYKQILDKPIIKYLLQVS